MASGSLSDALVGKHLGNINTQVASVTHSTINTNITNLGGTTRLGNFAGIDRGTISIDSASANTGTATVTAVTMSRSQLAFLGSSGYLVASSPVNPSHGVNARIVLTNTTTITATIDTTGYTGGRTIVFSYELTEYNA